MQGKDVRSGYSGGLEAMRQLAERSAFHATSPHRFEFGLPQMKPNYPSHPESGGLTDWIVLFFDLSYAERFQPFTVVMLDGHRYQVPTRDHVAIGYDAFSEPDNYFSILGDDDSSTRLSLFLIATIQLWVQSSL